jgi:hypothetical protein
MSTHAWLLHQDRRTNGCSLTFNNVDRMWIASVTMQLSHVCQNSSSGAQCFTDKDACKVSLLTTVGHSAQRSTCYAPTHPHTYTHTHALHAHCSTMCTYSAACTSSSAALASRNTNATVHVCAVPENLRALACACATPCHSEKGGVPA